MEKLLQHGIAVERLTQPVTLTVDQFNVTEVTGAPRLNQGHYTTRCDGDLFHGGEGVSGGDLLRLHGPVPWGRWRCRCWSRRATMAWCTGISSTAIWRPSGVRLPQVYPVFKLTSSGEPGDREGRGLRKPAVPLALSAHSTHG